MSILHACYGVSKDLNQTLRRNKWRFPKDFAFQLAAEEYDLRRSQIATTSRRNIRFRPWAFTGHGALQAANILRSDRVIAMTVYVIRAFIEQRETLAANSAILKRLDEIDKTLLEHDTALRDIYENFCRCLHHPQNCRAGRSVPLPHRNPRL